MFTKKTFIKVNLPIYRLGHRYILFHCNGRERLELTGVESNLIQLVACFHQYVDWSPEEKDTVYSWRSEVIRDMRRS